MSTISLHPPESIHKQLRELAKRGGISINQFVTTALAEKISALMTREYLDERAQRGSRAQFEQALGRVSATAEPVPNDKL